MNNRQRKKVYRAIMFYKGDKLKRFFGFGGLIGFKHGKSFAEFEEYIQQELDKLKIPLKSIYFNNKLNIRTVVYEGE